MKIELQTHRGVERKAANVDYFLLSALDDKAVIEVNEWVVRVDLADLASAVELLLERQERTARSER